MASQERTNRVFRTKVAERHVDALAALLSHDPDLVVAHDGGGLVSYEDYAALVSLLNALRSPFREYIGGAS